MIEIFLDRHKVFSKPEQQIKFTMENPYITGCGSYTLEISFPMSIWANKEFFGPIERVDVSKDPRHFEAKILSDNKEAFYGTATLSSITNEEVRVQLVGGNSEVNFLSKYESIYIDDIDFHNVDMVRVIAETQQAQPTGSIHKGIWSVIFCYDSTNDAFLNGTDFADQTVFDSSISPGFLFSLHMIVEGMGFKVVEDEYLSLPINSLYVMSGAKVTPNEWDMADVLKRTLPHWSFQEYIQQVQNLLNATVFFDERKRTARILRNDITIRQSVGLDILNEYSVEIDEKKSEDTTSTRNLKYGNNGEVEENGIERWKNDMHDLFEHKLFKNAGELREYVRTHGQEAEKYILCCPEGTAVYMSEDNSLSFQDYFGKQYRGAKEDFEFKICPPITKTLDLPSGAPTYVPVIKGPEELIAGENVMVKHMVFGYETDYSSTVKKEDAKCDEILLSPEGIGLNYRFMMSLHTSGNTNQPQNTWSFTIGDLHKNPIKIKDKILHKFDFLSGEIPDINKFFIIRNKKFIPKKIEYTLTEEGINKHMTGYFYELKS